MERKTISLIEYKAVIADGDSGGFSGYGSVFGNVDSYGDIVMPGSFTDTIPTFLREGFIGASHDWDEAIAIPIEAREDQKGLYIEAAFHSDSDAQRVRTRMNERAALGKSVGLSIGYETEAYEFVAADVAQAAGLAQASDPEHFMGGYRKLTKINLYEVSIVTVPANRAATVTGVKADERMTFSESVEHVGGLVSDLTAFAERLRSRADLRKEAGRGLSDEQATAIAEYMESLRGVAGDIDGLLIKPVDLRALRVEAIRYEQNVMNIRERGLLEVGA